MNAESIEFALVAQEAVYADLVGIHIPTVEGKIAQLEAEIAEMRDMDKDQSRRDLYAERVSYYRWRASHRKAMAYKQYDRKSAEIELKKLNREECRIRTLCADLRTRLREAQHAERVAQAAVVAAQLEGDALLRDVYCLAARMAKRLRRETGEDVTLEERKLFDVTYVYLTSRGLIEP